MPVALVLNTGASGKQEDTLDLLAATEPLRMQLCNVTHPALLPVRGQAQ